LHVHISSVSDLPSDAIHHLSQWLDDLGFSSWVPRIAALYLHVHFFFVAVLILSGDTPYMLMATDDDIDTSRIAALCHKLGRLCSEKEIDEWHVQPPPAAVEECKLTLIGKIPSNPSFNFQAFKSVLTRAWKSEKVDIIQREEGIYLAKFRSQAEKQRILETGPWQFSGHLINFKPWVANTPLHCYDFSTCAFWVKVIGLPLE